MRLFDEYVRVLCHGKGMSGTLSAMDLNEATLRVPPADFQIMLSGENLDRLPMIDDDGSLSAYMRRYYFDALRGFDDVRWMPQPMRVSRVRLATMAKWEEWQVLKGYLSGQGLAPFIVFHNAPFHVEERAYYTGDIRLWANKGAVLE